MNYLFIYYLIVVIIKKIKKYLYYRAQCCALKLQQNKHAVGDLAAT